MLDDVGLIHMNGRLYDPTLGVFMQGDPNIQSLGNLQNYNRYGYCFNNPLNCTDPTGQDFGIIDSSSLSPSSGGRSSSGIIDLRTARLLTCVGGGLRARAQWILRRRTIWHGQAALAGFASGAISTGTFKGAVQGAFTAGLFSGVGDIISENFPYLDTATGNITNFANYAGAVALHGVVGCVTSVMGGGKCGPGALSAAFSKSGHTLGQGR